MLDLGPAGASWLPTYGESIGTAALLFTFVQAYLLYLKTIKVKAASEASRESLWAKSEQVEAKVKVVADDLTAHKLMVAKDYVATEMLVRVENRLFAAITEVTAAIHGMSDRLDRAMDRSPRETPHR